MIRQVCLVAYFIVSFFKAYSTKQKPATLWQVFSPDTKICFQLSLGSKGVERGRLFYSVFVNHKSSQTCVLQKSPLGLVRQDEDFTESLSYISHTSTKKIFETFTLLTGRRTNIDYTANEISVTFNNNHNTPIQVICRASNDGVAFSYFFPGASKQLLTVTKEQTGFKFPQGGKAWIQPYDVSSKFSPAYEKYYESDMPIGTSSPGIEGWALPGLFYVNKYWLLIGEANLKPNYCGIRLQQHTKNGLYKVRFPEVTDAQGTGEVYPVSALPWQMPWRFVIIGASLSTIISSSMVHNLSDTATINMYSWVKPGRSSWGWLTDNNSPKNFETLKSFVDLSNNMGWEYSLVDANWDLMEGGDIKQLIDYAVTKNVGIWMWYNSGGPHNEVSERPRDIIFDAQKRKEAFKKLMEWGVKGIKIDFWHSDKQNLVQLYHDVLMDAAVYKLMVNFHGCTIPRGWGRKYPNLVSMESVRGAENYLFDETYPARAAQQNTILPFTRNVIGPMDYTPVLFSNVKYPHQTSYAHELALSIIFNSGILHFADKPDSYYALPAEVKDFLKTVPVVFDDVNLISGYPGKQIVLACKKNMVWYLAGINAAPGSYQLDSQLPFLKNVAYKAQVFADGETPQSFKIWNTQITNGKGLKITIKKAGGFVAVLSPVKK
jgi:alpha-glucosidase